MNFFFSVVIPTYNRNELIADTIKSVINQDTKKTIEIIVIDDGSTDKTKDTVLNLDYQHIKYFYQPNSGANKARNRGIMEAQGKYIAFLDADDRYLPYHLSDAEKLIEEESNIIVYSQVIADRGNGNFGIKPPRSIFKKENMAEYIICNKGFVQTSTIVLPTNFARGTKYLEWLKNGQDIDFAIRLSNKGHKFRMHERPSVLFRDIYDNKRISSSSQVENREKWISWIKNEIPSRAFYGYKGWFIAKAYIQKGNYLKGFNMYFLSLIKGAYPIKIGLIIFVQLVLGNSYRSMIDFILRIKKYITFSGRDIKNSQNI